MTSFRLKSRASLLHPQDSCMQNSVKSPHLGLNMDGGIRDSAYIFVSSSSWHDLKLSLSDGILSKFWKHELTSSVQNLAGKDKD